MYKTKWIFLQILGQHLLLILWVLLLQNCTHTKYLETNSILFDMQCNDKKITTHLELDLYCFSFNSLCSSLALSLSLSSFCFATDLSILQAERVLSKHRNELHDDLHTLFYSTASYMISLGRNLKIKCSIVISHPFPHSLSCHWYKKALSDFRLF